MMNKWLKLILLLCTVSVSALAVGSIAFAAEYLGYRDEFNAVSYSGNDGARTWSNDWSEWGDDNNVRAGKVRVVSCPRGLTTYCLQFGSAGKDAGVSRIADLSDAASSSLTFNWRRGGKYYGNRFTVEVRTDGGRWYPLLEIPDGFETSVHTETRRIPSGYLSTNTEVRFIPKDLGEGYLYVDNVHIELYGPTAVTLASHSARSASQGTSLLLWIPVLILWTVLMIWMVVRGNYLHQI